jgi:hypothetical protein
VTLYCYYQDLFGGRLVLVRHHFMPTQSRYLRMERALNYLARPLRRVEFPAHKNSEFIQKTSGCVEGIGESPTIPPGTLPGVEIGIFSRFAGCFWESPRDSCWLVPLPETMGFRGTVTFPATHRSAPAETLRYRLRRFDSCTTLMFFN